MILCAQNLPRMETGPRGVERLSERSYGPLCRCFGPVEGRKKIRPDLFV